MAAESNNNGAGVRAEAVDPHDIKVTVGPKTTTREQTPKTGDTSIVPQVIVLVLLAAGASLLAALRLRKR